MVDTEVDQRYLSEYDLWILSCKNGKRHHQVLNADICIVYRCVYWLMIAKYWFDVSSILLINTRAHIF